MKKRQPADGTLSVTANGHTLTGTYTKGRWRFVCPSWPDIATTYED